MGRPSKIPSSSRGRSSTDCHQLFVRPVNRNADSSKKADDSVPVEVKVQNLSQNFSLPQPEGWMNSTLVEQLHWQYDRRLSLSSEESQHDLENSDEQVQRCQVMSSCLNPLNSDSTQQPDSTVLSPAETNLLDELEETFLPPENPLASRSLQTKGPPALLPLGIRSSLGRRANSEDKQQTQEKRKKTTLVESDGRLSRMPGQLQTRPYNGRKVNGKNNLDPLSEAKQPEEVSCATNGQSVRTSSMTLPLMKENGLNVAKSVDCLAIGQAVGCSSPSVTSSLSSDAVRNQRADQGPINSPVGRSIGIGGMM